MDYIEQKGLFKLPYFGRLYLMLDSFHLTLDLPIGVFAALSTNPICLLIKKGDGNSILFKIVNWSAFLNIIIFCMRSKWVYSKVCKFSGYSEKLKVSHPREHIFS